MAQSVYIESSVISYLVARPSRDVVVAARQAIAETWWQNQRAEFDLFVSSLVVQEISRGDAAASERRLQALENIPLLKEKGSEPFSFVIMSEVREKCHD